MAPQRRSGGDSYILIIRQLLYGTPAIGADIFDGTAPEANKARPVRKNFPFTRNTLDPTSEETESDSIIGAGATPASIISKRGGGGEWEFELLPDDAIHMLLGWFNPTALPTNTAVPEQVIPASEVSVSGRTATIDISDARALAKWPGRLKIKPSGASGAGSFRIVGQKRGSRSNRLNTPITETVAIGDSVAEVMSKNFLYRADKIEMTWASGGTLPTGIALSYVPDTQMAELTLNENGNIFNGWSAQMIKALTPYIAYDIIPNLFRLSIGTNIRLLMGLLSSYVQESRSLVDPTVIANTLANLRTPNTGILARYPREALNFYPSYGTAVVLGNAGESMTDLLARIENNTAEPIAVTSVDIEGNHNYTDPEGFTGDPNTGQPVTSETESRTVTVNASVYHETDDATENNQTVHWQDIYFERRRVPIVIRNYNWLADGRQVMVESRFPNCGLTEVPGLPIEGRGSATRNLAFEAAPSIGNTTPDEISMRFYSEKGFAE